MTLAGVDTGVITSSALGGSLITMLVVGIFLFLIPLGIGLFCYKQRLLMFKWVGAIRATVHNQVGSECMVVQDQLREVKQPDGRIIYESKIFKETLPSENIAGKVMQLGKNRTVQIFRAGGEYHEVEYTRGIDGKIYIAPVVRPELKQAILEERQVTKDWLSDASFFEKYGALIGAALFLMTTVVVVFVITQYAAGANNATTAQLAQATNNLATIVNQTAAWHGIQATPPPA